MVNTKGKRMSVKDLNLGMLNKIQKSQRCSQTLNDRHFDVYEEYGLLKSFYRRLDTKA